MVQILPPIEKGPSPASQFAESLGNFAQEFMQRKQAMSQLRSENEAIKQQIGIDLTGINDPKQRQMLTQSALEFRNKFAEQENKYNLRKRLIDEIQDRRQSQHSPDEVNDAIDKASQQLGMDSTPEDIDWVRNQIEGGQQEEDPFKEAELYAAAGEPNLSQVAKERAKSALKKTENAKKETLPLRKEYADKAKYASQGIENKKYASSLLKKGDIDNPEKVYFASLLPGAIGNKLLSDDTHLYKAGLFEEFGVLKNMFPGQIRVKEIELLEDKLATLDKSHSAKQKILDIGAKKLERDLILAKTARKVEKKYPEASYLEFQQLVQEQSQPELDKLFDEIVNDYDKIYLEYAPAKSSYVDQNGNKYHNVPKKDLKFFMEEAKKEGIDLRPL